MIVTVDRNWGIGNKKRCLVNIPADMRFVNTVTMGKVIVMSKSTMSEFPGGRPLKGRTNVCLTSDTSFSDPEAVVVGDIEELVLELSKYNTDDVYIVGGEYIYSQLLKYCDEVFVTKIDFTYEADAHFENLDKNSEWELVGESDEETYYDLEYTNLRYTKK